MLSLFHIYPFSSFQPYQSHPPPETLHYIHLFIQLDSFTICTLAYIIITILFLHLHFTTITFRQTTNSACAHQLRLAPQYDMHIYRDRDRSTRLCGARSGSPEYVRRRRQGIYAFRIPEDVYKSRGRSAKDL